jgi:hypothetical protein
MKSTENKSPNFNIIETLLFTVLWVAIFSLPFFTNRELGVVDWNKVSGEWIRTTSFLILFLLNVYLFVPQFLFQKKYLFYITFTIVGILAITGIGLLLRIYMAPPEPLAMPRMDLGPGMPPMELHRDMQPIGFRAPVLPEQKSIFMIFADNIIIAFLVVGMSTAIKMVIKWLNEEGLRKDVEKEQLKTELALLRYQVSPHFFMNTLNNIHALVDINTETAKDAIIRLSTLMRYLLYDTSHGHTSLKKEIEFIESYISLMKLRFSKKVVITLEIPDQIPDLQIPPMLYNSIIENAFKHGVSYQQDSFVSFKLAVKEGHLFCEVKNSKHKNRANLEQSHSGIGMTNIKKSLELLFDQHYTLDILENDTTFTIQLTIPIYEN